MRIIAWLFLLINIGFPSVKAQEIFNTKVNNTLVKSLQVKIHDEDISIPVIELNGDQHIEISFDVLNSGYDRYAYSIIHCNANWQQSILSPIEYMSGFPGMPIEDFAAAMGTTVQYANYKLLLPNDDIQFKASGNYAVQVYSEDNPDRIVFTACFSIVEPMVNISANVSGNTNIDTNQTHQQVNFTVNHRNFPIAYPQNDLKIWVCQNNRRDNAVTNIQPMGIRSNEIEYANNRQLIFDAGNEFRRMEFLSSRYNGMRVESTSFHNPYYHIELMVDPTRDRAAYQYDQDQNGRIFINCSGCNDPDTEADYQIVHFTLDANRLPEAEVYLNSELYNYELNERSKMNYNPERGCYEKIDLLKQGSYNYQYLVVPNGQAQGLTGPMEGNHYQAENEYTIYVYYHSMRERYDRLVGVTTVQNKMQLFF